MCISHPGQCSCVAFIQIIFESLLQKLFSVCLFNTGRSAFQVQDNMMNMRCIWLDMFNMLNIGPPLGTSHFQQKTGNPPRCIFSPGVPSLSINRPPGIPLCVTVTYWSSCPDCKWRGDVLMNVQNTTSLPFEHSTGCKPALFRARYETQVHSIGKVTQLELEGKQNHCFSSVNINFFNQVYNNHVCILSFQNISLF